jgi:hypothetical protein
MFHLPAASTPPEAAEQLAVTHPRQTPITSTHYDFVAQIQGPLSQNPQALPITLENSASVSPESGIPQSVDEHGDVENIGCPSSLRHFRLPAFQSIRLICLQLRKLLHMN